MTELFNSGDAATLNSLFDAVLRSVPDAMIVINQSGLICAFSATAEKLFGYSATEVNGRNVSLLMTDNDRSHHDQYISNYIETGEKQIIGIGRVVQAQLKDGSKIPVELKIGEANLGDARYFTGYIRDVTKKQETEHSLNQIQAELANFSRLSAVGTMASAMAHELNQPLTAVSNYLEAARDLIQTPNPNTMTMIHEALDAAATQSIRAGLIIRRLRDYVARGEVDSRPTDIATVLRDAMSVAKVGTEGPTPRLVDAIGADLPMVICDQLQIRQVVVNLIKNASEALKDTPAPLIWISAWQKDTEEICVEISDNGPGLNESDGHSVFDAFYTSKSTGMGLGLSICQTIIDAHNGSIWTETAPDRGAIFKFTLKTISDLE